MKLSDLFSTLAQGAQEFEKRAARWQEEFRDRQEDLVENVRKWREAATQRETDLNSQIRDYFDQASDQVKAQWETAKEGWDSEVEKVRAKSAEMRKQAETMQAGDLADWTEAYAANMVAFAKQMQEEASNAIAAAAEARAKARATDKA